MTRCRIFIQRERETGRETGTEGERVRHNGKNARQQQNKHSVEKVEAKKKQEKKTGKKKEETK